MVTLQLRLEGLLSRRFAELFVSSEAFVSGKLMGLLAHALKPGQKATP